MSTYNNIQEALLMRQNVADEIQALNELGFTEINSRTPLSELADYVKWAGGLRDLRLATINKNTGAYKDYSEEEWNDLSATAKSTVIKLGIRVRVERQDFIIAKDNCLRASNGNVNIPWCNSTGSDVRGLTNYGPGSSGAQKDFDSKGNTDAILAFAKSSGLVFEAASQARAYKASTVADGGYDDPTEWQLPALGILLIMYKYKTKINAAIKTFLGSDNQLISGDYYWSSTEYSAANAWTVSMGSGSANYYVKTYSGRVRPVAPVPVSAAI